MRAAISALSVCALTVSTICAGLFVLPAEAASHHHHKTRHHSQHTRGHVSHTKRHGLQVVQYYGRSRTAGFTRAPYSHAVYYTGGAGDYVSQTEGISRWPDGHTIRVYVAPARATFPGIVAHCFDQWSRATGGRINYRLVSNPGAADYVVSWSSHQHEASDGTEAGLTTTDTYVDPDTDKEYIDHAQTSILTRFDGRMLSDKEIAETVLHEIGHGLGIEGHSSNPADIMYYAVSSRQTGHLTPRDSNTIARLYAY